MHSRGSGSSKRGSSSAAGVSTRTKRFHPYFSPDEVTYLSNKQRGKTAESSFDKVRKEASGFLELVGSRLGFPHRTIATAQSLYLRFNLFYPMKDFAYWDVGLGSLYVSSKMHDTLKKPRELLMASYPVRFPEMANRARVGELEIDPATLETDRRRMIAIERLVLETICFNFKVRTPFPYVIKCGRSLGASKELTKFAYKLAIDSHRTITPLEHPPHTIALACIYLAALLTAFPEYGGSSPLGEMEWAPHETNGSDRRGKHDRKNRIRRTARQIGTLLGEEGQWTVDFGVRISDIQEITHQLIDFLTPYPIGSYAHSLSTSPATPFSPASPSPNQASPSQNPLSAVSQGTSSWGRELMKLKIHLREKEVHAERPRIRDEDPSNGYAAGGVMEIAHASGRSNAVAAEVWGDSKQEGAVRFFFE